MAAASELGKRGYRIIGSNYRCRSGEIDLIARDGDTLVFVEVRCKRTADYGTPAESITQAKQQKLAATAQHYLIEHGLEDVDCRFDVAEVSPANGGLAVHVIRDAFSV
ncbi:MAG: YraN family protein [Armatimonadetes bacterium RBG_16_58_9]|nr:MAG: YraN family protein [Armatimonadetes bacterium RBG_16_58_9]